MRLGGRPVLLAERRHGALLFAAVPGPMRWLRMWVRSMGKLIAYPIPLARKISLLFGSAVLLVIAVTLAFPMLQMTGLHQQAMLLRRVRLLCKTWICATMLSPRRGTGNAPSPCSLPGCSKS